MKLEGWRCDTCGYMLFVGQPIKDTNDYIVHAFGMDFCSKCEGKIKEIFEYIQILGYLKFETKPKSQDGCQFFKILEFKKNGN